MMKKWTNLSKNTAILCAVGMMAFITGCSNSSTINNSGPDPFSNPDSLSFSQEHYAKALRATYLRLAYQLPEGDTLLAIENASTSSEAKALYETEIDNLIDSSLLEARMRNYFKEQLDVWSDNDGEEAEQMRYGVNLGVYIYLTGKPIDEFLLAQYAVDDNGQEIPQTYDDGPPVEDQAGYITMEAYAEKYIGTFKFDMVREVLGLNLNTIAPYTDVELYRWTTSQLSGLYRNNPELSDINCEPCHVVNNPVRLAFRNYDEENYTPGQNQNQRQFNSEEADGSGFNREPRDANDEPIPQDEIYQYTKLTENGNTMTTPRDLALEIVAHPEFPRAWTERFLTILLDLNEGTTGPNKVVPEYFSGNEKQIEFLDEWTRVFEDNDRKGKELFRAFLKDPQYLVLVFNPNSGG